MIVSVLNNAGVDELMVKANGMVTAEAFSTASAQADNETELSIHIAVPETTLTPDQKANVLVIIRNDGRRNVTLKELGAVTFHLSITQRQGSAPLKGELFRAIFALKSNETVENGGFAKMIIDLSSLEWSDVLSSGADGQVKKSLFESVAPSEYYLIAELDSLPETSKDNPDAKSVRSRTCLVGIKKAE
jgi:hypothetical protein